MSSTLTDTAFTFTNVVQGGTYQFKVEARNAYGYSEFSNTLTVSASEVPEQPAAPTTTWLPDDIVISWTTPDDNGSPIIGYTIKV